MGSIEEFEHAQMFFRSFIRRINKEKVSHQMTVRDLPETGQNIGLDQFPSGADSECCQIVANEPRGLEIGFDEDYLSGPAADRLDADRSGAGIEIDEQRIVDRWPQDIEERFAQPVAGRPKT